MNVDATGATDVTSSLASFIASSPNGSSICFAPGGTYRITGQLHLQGRSNLTLVGNGATIYQSVRATTPILLIDGGGTGIKVTNLTIKGSNPTPGKWVYAYEHNHGIAFGGPASVDVDRVTVKNVGGDGIYLTSGNGQWMNGLSIHDSTFDGIGRMGIAFTDGISNASVERNVFRNVGYYTTDIEPNGVTIGGRLAGAEHVVIRSNTIGPKPYGDYPTDSSQACGFAFVTTGSSGGGYINDIQVYGNTMAAASPPFRYGIFAGTNVSVHDNPGQTTAGPC